MHVHAPSETLHRGLEWQTHCPDGLRIFRSSKHLDSKIFKANIPHSHLNQHQNIEMLLDLKYWIIATRGYDSNNCIKSQIHMELFWTINGCYTICNMAEQFLMESCLSVIDEEDIEVGYAYLECILLFHTKIPWPNKQRFLLSSMSSMMYS